MTPSEKKLYRVWVAETLRSSDKCARCGCQGTPRNWLEAVGKPGFPGSVVCHKCEKPRLKRRMRRKRIIPEIRSENKVTALHTVDYGVIGAQIPQLLGHCQPADTQNPSFPGSWVPGLADTPKVVRIGVRNVLGPSTLTKTKFADMLATFPKTKTCILRSVLLNLYIYYFILT